MKVHQTFECDTCGRVYQSAEAATTCENQPTRKLKAQPGDTVVSGSSFGWFDGDERWVSNFKRIGPMMELAPGRRRKCPNGDSNCFASCCNYQFYYVVGAVEMRREKLGMYLTNKAGEPIVVGGEPVYSHQLVYHLFTKAMTGRQGYAEGWTSVETHYDVKKVKNPPALDGSEFIGKRTEVLL